MTALLTTVEQLREVLREEMPQAIEKAKNYNPEKLFTFSQASEKLGKSYNLIWRLAKSGRIQTTADGKYISQQAINQYLNHKNQ